MRAKTSEEMTPSEWLLWLGGSDTHRRLLDQAGSLPAAAYHLAKVKCTTAPTPTEVPTLREVRGAAREIARRVGLHSVPEGRALALECEALGLPVIH